MNDDQFDQLVIKIQEQVFAEAQEAYGTKGFDRWRNPQYNGRMENADAKAVLTGDCGDTMEIFLKFKHNMVVNASYITDGCGSSALCGSFTAEKAIGRTPEEIYDLTAETILNAIGTFPEKEKHCAYLAIRTLQDAVDVYMGRQVQVERHQDTINQPVPTKKISA